MINVGDVVDYYRMEDEARGEKRAAIVVEKEEFSDKCRLAIFNRNGVYTTERFVPRTYNEQPGYYKPRKVKFSVVAE